MVEATSIAHRFPSFSELQTEHLALMRNMRALNEQERGTSIEILIDRVKNTGTILEGSERRAAQNILDYWSAEAISQSEIAENWSPPRLLPSEESAGKSTASPETILGRKKAIKGLQLAATARLYKDSGDTGYLLKGAALEAAAQYKDDPDVGELVRASRADLRFRRRMAYAGSIIILLLICVGTAAGYFVKQSRIFAATKAALNAASSSTQDLNAQIEQKNAIIAQLTTELHTAKVPFPTQVTEVVANPTINTIAPPSSRTNARLGQPQNSKQGFIWIGQANAPNLIDLNTLVPVKPSDVVVGNKYKVTQNIVLRSGLPTEDYVSTSAVGVVLAQTTVKITTAPKAYSRPTGLQYWAGVTVEAPNQPIVYIEYTDGTATLAQIFGQAASKNNFQVSSADQTDQAKGFNEIRYFYPPDRAAANRLQEVIATALTDAKLQGIAPPKVVDMTTRPSDGFPGVLELWIDLASTKS